MRGSGAADRPAYDAPPGVNRHVSPAETGSAASAKPIRMGRGNASLAGRLRRERHAFAVLGLLLLLAQSVFGGGFTAAAAALAGLGGAVLCSAAGTAAPGAPGTRHDGHDCPCLPGTCSPAVLAGTPPPGGSAAPRRIEAGRIARPASPSVERRPIRLFARGSRGPPLPS